MNASSTAIAGDLLQEPPRYERVTIQIASVRDSDEVQVRISAHLNHRYEAEARAIELFCPDGQRLDLEYTVRPNLDAMRKELSARIETLYRRSSPISKYVFSEPMQRVPDEQLRLALGPIARSGRAVYRRLFDDIQDFDSHPPGDVELLRQVVRSVLGRPNVVVIKSHMSLFPWGFLYDDPVFDPDNLISLDPYRFWGFKHQIEEEIRGVARRVPIQRPARLAAAVCTDTDTQREHEQGPFGEFARRNAVEVRLLQSTAELREALSNFDSDCLYFYGHANQTEPPTQTTSCLKLNGLELTADDLDQRGVKFHKCPVFIFLNGCETTPLNAWNEHSLAGLLCFKGEMRVCCMTTFARVPIPLGRAFGIAFWHHFLQSNTLGESILHARTMMLDKYANPLGLLYTLFGCVDTRLK